MVEYFQFVPAVVYTFCNVIVFSISSYLLHFKDLWRFLLIFFFLLLHFCQLFLSLFPHIYFDLLFPVVAVSLLQFPGEKVLQLREKHAFEILSFQVKYVWYNKATSGISKAAHNHYIIHENVTDFTV